MRRKFPLMLVLAVAAVTGFVYIRAAMATPSSGFASTTIALGRLGEIDVFNRSIPQGPDVWLSLQKTKGLSDVYVQSNVWQPGGQSGWHTHPGHSIITVTGGQITVYEGEDPACKPTVYGPGMSLVDAGGDHAHLIRNEGAVPATSITFQLLPAGAVRRIDIPSPGNCGF